jgi:hypothetical protein
MTAMRKKILDAVYFVVTAVVTIGLLFIWINWNHSRRIDHRISDFGAPVEQSK